MSLKNRYWLSWYHRTEYGGFELFAPWWVTGTFFDVSMDPAGEMICAHVQATDEAKAKRLVERSYDNKPENISWRFCDIVPHNWRPGDRFPRADWMDELN